MREFRISSYIRKYLPHIVIFCVLATIAIAAYLSLNQTYVATAVIEYNSDGAESGLTPDGQELDVSEIKSSAVISEVIENLDLDASSYSVDELISRVLITPVVDADEESLKEAVIENGEEYTTTPTIFEVSFEARHNEGENFARNALDEILDVYFAKFSEKYINSSSIINTVSGIYDKNYDYIEMMELIDSSMKSANSALSERKSASPYFRATVNGMSFGDLVDQFYYLQSVTISDLFSRILDNQITKNKGLLVSNYSERIKNNGISNNADQSQIEDIEDLIESYVQKMRDSDNTNITYEYILDNVYERDLTDSEGEQINWGDQTVTYDKLIYSWRDHEDDKKHDIIDAAYCDYIIKVFTSCTGACTGEETSEGHLLSSISVQDSVDAQDINGETDVKYAESAATSGSGSVTAQPESEADAIASATTPETNDDTASSGSEYAVGGAGTAAVAGTAGTAGVRRIGDESDGADISAAFGVSDQAVLTTACANSEKTCAELNDPQYAEKAAAVEKDIRSLVDRLDELYRLADETNSAYNDYLGATNISTLSSPAVTKGTNVALYTAIAAIFLLVICCGGAIVIGRLGDIVQYTFYTDRLTGLGNRNSFDDYLKENEKKVTPDGTAFISFIINNQAEINRTCGRNVGDELLKYVGDCIKEVFSDSGNQLIYNGNSQFMIVSYDTGRDVAAGKVKMLRVMLDQRNTARKAAVDYSVGMSESESDGVRSLRGLLSKAVSAQAAYTSPAKE